MDNRQGRFLSSLENAQEYLDLVEKHQLDSNKVANVEAYKGINYYYLDEYGLSADAFLKAIKYFKEVGDSRRLAICYHRLADTYSELQDYDKAIAFIKNSIETSKKSPENNQTTATRYVSLASYLIYDNQLNQAQIFLDSAQSLYRGIPTPLFYRRYGNLEEKRGNEKKAINYAKKAVNLCFENNETLVNTIEALHALAHLNKKYGYPQENIELLEGFLQEYALQKSYYPRLTELEDFLFDAYTETGKYKKAITLRSSFEYLHDSIQSLETAKQVGITEIRSNAAKQEAEFELLKKQDELHQQTIKAQNTLLFSALIIILLVLGVTVIIYRASKLNKKLSDQNKAQAERLIQLDAAKSRFFANISHDLRTPMTLIMGGIQKVLENENIYLDSKSEKQLSIGLKNGERIIHLTNEINELIKLEDGQMQITCQYVDINQLLSLFVEMFSSMAEIKGVHLAYSYNEIQGGTIVSIDPHHFEKVLFNLITNGLKHTQADQSVTVSLSKVEDDLCISILDTGEGIPKENVPYIFDRYYQAPDTTFKTQEGFGIGLALVKEIIDKHGAKISVESRQGHGTEFRILLKQEQAKPEEIVPLSRLDYSYEKREIFKDIDEVEADSKTAISIDSLKNRTSKIAKQTILLVEDHPEVREYIYDIISDYYTVITAPNGKKALQMLENEHVDLIITDLMMPWFDGFELLEELKNSEHLRKIPALVLSARTSEQDKERVLNNGVNDFLGKPFKTKELLQRIENLLNKTSWNNTDPSALFINSQETMNEVENTILFKVEQLILERMQDPELSVTEIADKICISERKLYRMLKKMKETTPFEYIKEIRLQQAHRLVQNNQVHSASELARLVGMKNVSNFNKQYKKRFGKNPSDFFQKV
ncbi:hybrid sensor histidine kinase/response regulator transcription factor [Reichenbachiella ulvae]|uniref:histidine kinase n=1 Tax=Reichenbachiella ulvae TaxID=2980104 RepID=A0ABT3CQG4_9BACT|nr:ATP-binding protein [Reichenbachiella ulvae]MCV9385902.1 response regulator [Reichenbachiella ulvae]